MLCATGVLSAPTWASEAESIPVALSHIDDLASLPLTAETLGLNELSDEPAPAAAADSIEAAVMALPHDTAPVLLPPEPGADAPEGRDGRSLAQLVSDFSASQTSSEEAECLARAVFFESNGEPLTGQLAVAEVIINRANSGRFRSTICGVVRQPGQFSFVRGGYIPRPPASAGWRRAVAIAEIAMRDLADSAASRALFFHARYVRPRWRLTRVATVGNHIFYR
ncbi:MAG: cell wall hydrolase [Sphingosinicella sp.]